MLILPTFVLLQMSFCTGQNSNPDKSAYLLYYSLCLTALQLHNSTLAFKPAVSGWRLISLISFLDQWVGVLDTNADRITDCWNYRNSKVSKYLPILVFTLVFAVINILERNIASGIILCVFAGFGIYLALRLLTRRQKKHPKTHSRWWLESRRLQ